MRRMCLAAGRLVQDLKLSSTVIDFGGPLSCTGDESCSKHLKVKGPLQ